MSGAMAEVQLAQRWGLSPAALAARRRRNPDALPKPFRLGRNYYYTHETVRDFERRGE